MKFILQHTLLLLVITALIYVYYYGTEMNNYPIYFPLIPCFYILNGVVLYFILGNIEKSAKEISLKKMILLRIFRIAGSLILLIIGILLDKPHIIPFVIIYVIYYFAYLLLETQLMGDLNKINKTENV